nr:hypothetical protein CR513_39626 [Ipomoea trifida]
MIVASLKRPCGGVCLTANFQECSAIQIKPTCAGTAMQGFTRPISSLPSTQELSSVRPANPRRHGQAQAPSWAPQSLSARPASAETPAPLQQQPPSLPSTSSSSEDSSTRFYRETDPSRNGFLSKRTDENASSHYDPLNFQAQSLLHVVVLHDMDLERNIRVHQRLRHVVGLSSGEIVEIVLDLLLSLLVAGGGGLGVDGEIDGAPISAVEDGGRPDVEEDYGVAWTEIILDRPLHGVSALIAEIDCDGDLPVGPGAANWVLLAKSSGSVCGCDLQPAMTVGVEIWNGIWLSKHHNNKA